MNMRDLCHEYEGRLHSEISSFPGEIMLNMYLDVPCLMLKWSQDIKAIQTEGM